MSAFKDYFAQKNKRHKNIATADERKYLDAVINSATLSRLSLGDFLSKYPEQQKSVPVFMNWARKRNPQESLVNLIHQFYNNPSLNEMQVDEAMDVPVITNGDKVVDNFMPRRIGLVVNATPNIVAIKWQDGKMSNTSPANLKVVAKAHNFKKDDVVSKNGVKGVVINPIASTNMDIATTYPVVYVKWQDGKMNSINANDLELVHEHQIMGPVNADVHDRMTDNNRKHVEFVSAQKALGMLSDLSRTLLKMGKVVQSKDGLYEVQKAGHLYQIKKI